MNLVISEVERDEARHVTKVTGELCQSIVTKVELKETVKDT